MRSPLQSADKGVVSLLRLVVVVKQQRAVAAAPALLVGYTPYSDTNTLGNGKTSVHDGKEVASSSTLDVELGDGNLLDIRGSQSLEGSGNTRSRVPSTGLGKMALATDTINGDTLRDPLVDVSDHAGSDLGIVGNVEVVVVDVQLSVGVGGAGSLERNSHEVFTENAAEDAVAEASVFGEDLVNDIPLEDLALIVRDDGRYMVLEDRGQCVTVANLGHPGGQLRVPEKVMAANVFAVLLSPADDLISIGEIE
jgi:hypothetical protein